MDPSTNTFQNKNHYDQVFSHVSVDTLIQKVKNSRVFLKDAIETDTSWHGLYQGGFRDIIAGKQVLELGCGDGLNALIMAQLGANVTAIDISEKSQILIESANKQLSLSVTAISGDFQKMDFFNSQTFDFVLGKAFLHHLTHEVEKSYLEKVARLLKSSGEARFFEPAINSKWIDMLRWVTPVPGRPSILNRKEFIEWKKKDPHPIRDNSTKHYIQVGNLYFDYVQTIMIGSIERLCRVLPSGKFNRSYRRWAHRIEPKLPDWFRYSAARSQLIIYRSPKQ